MNWATLGWRISKGLLWLWPLLLLPGLMSLAASTSGLWKSCTHSWFTGFLCTSVFYPVWVAVLAWIILPFVRVRSGPWADRLGWVPALLLVVPFLLAWFA